MYIYTYIYSKEGNDNIITWEPTEEVNEHFYFFYTHPVATADHFPQEGGKGKKREEQHKTPHRKCPKPFALFRSGNSRFRGESIGELEKSSLSIPVRKYSYAADFQRPWEKSEREGRDEGREGGRKTLYDF